MIRYKENQDWECSVEKMISYLIEANRTITDPRRGFIKMSNQDPYINIMDVVMGKIHLSGFFITFK